MAATFYMTYGFSHVSWLGHSLQYVHYLTYPYATCLTLDCSIQFIAQISYYGAPKNKKTKRDSKDRRRALERMSAYIPGESVNEQQIQVGSRQLLDIESIGKEINYIGTTGKSNYWNQATTGTTTVLKSLSGMRSTRKTSD